MFVAPRPSEMPLFLFSPKWYVTRLRPWCLCLFRALAFTGYNSGFTIFPFYRARRFYLVHVLRYTIDPTSSIHLNCFFTGRSISIGANTIINRECQLDGREGLEIGENVSISPCCTILSAGHDPQSPDFGGKNGRVIIGDRVWLGTRSMILPGVKLGEGAVVGAGSVVTRDVEPFTIVAGSPARAIGVRNQDLVYQLNWRPFFGTDEAPPPLFDKVETGEEPAA